MNYNKIVISGVGNVGRSLLYQINKNVTSDKQDMTVHLNDTHLMMDSDRVNNLNIEYHDFENADVYFICVRTDLDKKIKDEKARHVLSIERILENLKKFDLDCSSEKVPVVVIASTLGIGSINKIRNFIYGIEGKDYHLIYTPHRYDIVEWKNPTVLHSIIGCDFTNSLEVYLDVYTKLVKSNLSFDDFTATSINEAVYVKLYENYIRFTTIEATNVYTQIVIDSNTGEKFNIDNIYEMASSKPNILRMQNGLISGHCLQNNTESLVDYNKILKGQFDRFSKRSQNLVKDVKRLLLEETRGVVVIYDSRYKKGIEINKSNTSHIVGMIRKLVDEMNEIKNHEYYLTIQDHTKLKDISDPDIPFIVVVNQFNKTYLQNILLHLSKIKMVYDYTGMLYSYIPEEKYRYTY